MNILFFHRLVGFIHGGTETHLKELAWRLAERGHDVEILTSKGKALSSLESLVKVHFVSRDPYFPYTARPRLLKFYFPYLMFLLKSFLKFLILLSKRRRWDIVSVHYVFEGFLMRFVRRLFSIPYVFILEGYTNGEAREARYADLKMAISKDIVKKCFSNYSYSPSYIPEGTDLQRFNPRVKGDDVREKYAKPNEKLILTVSRLDPRKDIPTTLIPAADIVCKRDSRIKFIIVGEGSERKKIEEEIKKRGLSDKVMLVGYVPDDQLPKYYRACDAFVLSSLYEGVGTVLLEAMGSGLPIISTAVGGVPEVVGKCGALVPPRRAELLAEKILQVAHNYELREKMIEKGLSRIIKYDWNQLIVEYEKAYESAIKSKAKRG